MNFEWDDSKNQSNLEKHGVTFETAQRAFADTNRLIVRDDDHSTPSEVRYFCYGKVEGSILTVRFTIRENAIRIFGAAHWRQGVKRYENR
ncbi:MAG: BrnT family toxin [Spirochaetales bacterium]